jgi:hypothetical protein
LKSFLFPDIRVISIEDLLFHELAEPKRVLKLEKRIRSDGYLKNPITVGRTPECSSKYLLIDGVHRVAALRSLGVSHITAHVLDYFDSGVKVDTWCHLIHNVKANELLSKINKIPNLNLEQTNFKRANSLLKQKKIACCLLFGNKNAFIVNSVDDLQKRTATLIEVMKAGFRSSAVTRGSETEAKFLLKRRKKANAVLMIPKFEKEEIVNLAMKGTRLPPGVTRHILPLRVLNFRVDLGFFGKNGTLDNKNKKIKKMLECWMEDGKTRFYPESVLIFDD